MQELPVKPLISVILPVLNGAERIDCAISAVLNQRLENSAMMELIIIDDGSTDATNSIIERWEKRAVTGKIFRHVHHDINLGVAASVIEGMKISSGEWLARIDHDDLYPENYLNTLLNAAIIADADMAVAPLSIINTNGITKARINKKSKSEWLNINKTRLDTVGFSLCNKLIKRELVENLNLSDIPNGLNCWDDVYILSRIVVGAKRPLKITSTNATTYHYRVCNDSTSLTHSSYAKIICDRIRCTHAVIELIEANNQAKYFSGFISQLKIRAKANWLRPGNLNLKAWKTNLPMSCKEILTTPCVPIPYRLLMALLNLSLAKNG